MRCAYLTMDDMGGFVTDAGLSLAPMADLGWTVEMVSWRDGRVCWDDYDAVYICTPWDYPQDPAAFLTVLESIDRSRALLVNSIDLVRWTIEKTYLRDLERRGADIVPSTWYENFESADVDWFFSEHASDKIVIKPVVGANAVDAFVVTKPVDNRLRDKLGKSFAARAFVVQPFIASIQGEGEYSLFFFSGEYSHAICKVPKRGDFRVQEEHGADIHSTNASQALVDAGRFVVGLVDPQPVYARADFVRGRNNRYLLMELELIEPSLYLRTDPGAAAKFARAFDTHVRQRA